MQLFPIILAMSLALTLGGCFDSGDKSVKFYGNVDVRTVSLAFRVSGRLNAIHFDEGQKVKQNDVIATLDDALYKEYLHQIDAQIAMQKATIAKLEKGYRSEEIQQAKAKLQQSKVERDRLKKEFHRAENLFKTNATSAQKFDDAKAAYEASKAAYRYAKSALEMLQNGYEKEDILSAKANLAALEAQRNLHRINLEDTTLTAPTNGTVITRMYEKGAIVGPSQPVVELAINDAYWVRSYMSETYLGVVKVGQRAHIHTDHGKTYEGSVSFISPIAEFTPKTVQTEELRTDLVYRFRIVLDRFDDSIKQGMPVTVTLDDMPSGS